MHELHTPGTERNGNGRKRRWEGGDDGTRESVAMYGVLLTMHSNDLTAFDGVEAEDSGPVASNATNVRFLRADNQRCFVSWSRAALRSG